MLQRNAGGIQMSLGVAAAGAFVATLLLRRRRHLRGGETGAFLRRVAPALDGTAHKGQAGRIGVLGGSVDFAGAPFYAGISALRVGAELLYLFTADEASGPIQAYSPELMVSRVYRHTRITDPSTMAEEQQAFVDRMVQYLPRLHALCIGPGLGRHPTVLEAVARVIEAARGRKLPLVIDADGLFLITERPELVKGYSQAVLTPNLMEYRRLAQAVLGDAGAELSAVCAALDGPVILQKGPVDRIIGSALEEPLECCEQGGPRRPGGIGDLLCGSLSTIVAWTVLSEESLPWACQAACTLVRRATRTAYVRHRRALVAPDIINELGPVFEQLCPAERSSL